jgi:oxygen-independent coproporphyrinogen-3 oxidase
MVLNMAISKSDSMSFVSPTQTYEFPFDQRIESHPWFEVGDAIDGEAAKKYLALERQSKGLPHPYCIYVHVPFCESICRFCALYTRGVRVNDDAVFDQYIDFVKQSIVNHPNANTGLGPTTVHFGGGTPLHIGLERFAVLTQTLKKAFGSPQSCEWALETTTSSLSHATLEVLRGLGFQRIHLGIQTLNDRLRKYYGRHESGEAAIDKLRFFLEQGFLCSVDLIIGFQDSTEEMLRNDLQRLYEVGIRMFSICELRQRIGKSLTAKQHEEQSQRNYHLWRIIWQFMQSKGLVPIHLGQFANSQKSNLYYTHPARSEDCVAIGPYAHGSSGRLYYSNKLLPDYYAAIQAGNSPIEKAVLYDDCLEAVLDLERELLAHQVSLKTLNKVTNVFSCSFPDLLLFWETRGLLLPEGDASSWTISAEGSWFIGNMIMQLRKIAEYHENV